MPDVANDIGMIILTEKQRALLQYLWKTCPEAGVYYPITPSRIGAELFGYDLARLNGHQIAGRCISGILNKLESQGWIVIRREKQGMRIRVRKYSTGKETELDTEGLVCSSLRKFEDEQKETEEKILPEIKACLESALETGELDFGEHTSLFRPRGFWEWDDAFSLFMLRDGVINDYGHALWCTEATECVRSYDVPIVAVGSGPAYVEALLDKSGVDIIATDKQPHLWERHHLPVQELDSVQAVQAVQKYPDRALFFSWPDYSATWAYDAVIHLPIGGLIFYIGEPGYGCTGDEQFVDFLTENCELLHDIKIPQHRGLHDRFFVFKRTA